jgi:hypothetical protein
MDNLCARDVLDRALVDRDRHRARHLRTDHPAVHHAGHLDVHHIVFLGEHLRRHVTALDRLADDLVVLVGLGLRLARGIERVAHLLVPLELHVEVFAAEQLGVGCRLRHVVVAAEHGDDTVVDL